VTHMESILKNKKAQRLLAANLISAIGSGISGIGVSWLLVNKPHGATIFGWTTLGLTILLFLLTPYIGVVIDRYSRKNIFLLINLISAAIILINIGVAAFIGTYATSQLILLFLTASLYFNFYFPTLTAFSQEIFHRSMFKRLNGVLEVQNQTAAIASGGIAGVVLGFVDYSYIFLFDALTFVACFLLILSIRYESVLEPVNSAQRGLKAFFGNVNEGISYLKDRPMFAVFLLCALAPFIVIMVTNYITPVFVSDTLDASAKIFGVGEMTYAVGAVVAGIAVPFVFHKLNEHQSVLLTLCLFSGGVLAIALFPSVPVFIAAYLFLGFGNAGTRIARKTMMMELIPNRLIGRVTTFLQSVGLLIRIILIGSFTLMITRVGAVTAWWVLFFFMAAAITGIFLSKKSILRFIEVYTRVNHNSVAPK
jgi:MFS family permease